MLLSSFVHQLSRFVNHNADCVAELEDDRNALEQRLLKIERELLDAHTTTRDLQTEVSILRAALEAVRS